MTTTENRIKSTITASKTYTQKEITKMTRLALFEYGIDPGEIYKITDLDICSEYEVWIPVPSLRCKYEISNLGRLRNAKRKRIIKPQLRGGYVFQNLHHNGGGVYIHRLVGECFLSNDDPCLKNQIDHLNGNKSDNTILNLEWVSHKENVKRAFENGFAKGCPGKKVAQIKNGTIINIYDSVVAAAKKVGVTPSCISAVCSNRLKTAAGSEWAFLIA